MSIIIVTIIPNNEDVLQFGESVVNILLFFQVSRIKAKVVKITTNTKTTSFILQNNTPKLLRTGESAPSQSTYESAFKSCHKTSLMQNAANRRRRPTPNKQKTLATQADKHPKTSGQKGMEMKLQNQDITIFYYGVVTFVFACLSRSHTVSARWES